MLPLLEQMLEALNTHWSLPDSVLYQRMAPEIKDIRSDELREVLLRAIETDPGVHTCGSTPASMNLWLSIKLIKINNSKYKLESAVLHRQRRRIFAEKLFKKRKIMAPKQ